MIVGLIPARSGSKSIKDKNIYPLKGYPLMAWSIVASLLTKSIDKTIVSTNSDKYAEIAIKYGAEVLWRPEYLCQDDSPDDGYLNHAFGEIGCDYIVLLRPTTPLRNPNTINQVINCKIPDMILRSMYKMSESAYKCMRILEGKAVGISSNPNTPRQFHPDTYHPNGYVDIIPVGITKWEIVKPFITEDVGELDCLEDFDYIEWRIDKYGNPIYDYLREKYPI